VADPELVRRASDAFGSQAIVVAVDARHRPDRPGNWEVFHPRRAAKPTDIDAVAWCARHGGTGRRGDPAHPAWIATARRDGFDLELTRAVADRVPIPVIASGGVGTLETSL